jgi:hypothetical protein
MSYDILPVMEVFCLGIQIRKYQALKPALDHWAMALV